MAQSNSSMKEAQNLLSNGALLTPSRKKVTNGSSMLSNGKKMRTPPAGQAYALGCRVEAKDFSGHWYPGTVSEVDLEEGEILIRFDKSFDKSEEWMPMDSQRVRPFKEPDSSSLHPANLNPGRLSGINGQYVPEPKLERRFKVGEPVMAAWTNNRKYPATIASQQPNDRYDVVFYDGFSKSVRGSKISKMKESDLMSKRSINGHSLPVVGNHTQIKTQYPTHFQPSAHLNQPKNQPVNGNFLAGNSSSFQYKSSPHGQSQLEKQLLQPPIVSNSSFHNASVNGLLSFDENIGTKEQRRERKRKHNVKELFSTKRPRGSEKLSSSKAEGLTPSGNHDGKYKQSMQFTESEVKKKRRRLKKKQDGFGSNTQESSVKRPKAVSSDDEECSIQWTNGEPQGEAAYVIESSEGLRKSIIVDDRRLPMGWSKHAIRRQGGTSAGKWDVFLVRPDGSTPAPTHQSPEASSVPQSTSSFADHSVHQAAASHPSTPQSVTPQVVSHGVQRVKTLLPRRTPTLGGSLSRRVLSPPPPHAVTPQPLGPVSSSIEALNKKSLSAGSDGYVCPKDGCGKRFRKENLLQMHIKHYHPEYTAFMGSTPNVADLAYARTVGEIAADTPNRNKAGPSSSFLEKIERISRMEAHRKAGIDSSVSSAETTSSLEAKSPTLGQLLKKGPMRKDSLDGTTAAAQAAAAWMVETASDSTASMSPLHDSVRDKLGHVSSAASLDGSYRDRTESVSRPVSRTAGFSSDCDQDAGFETNGNCSPWKSGAIDASASMSSSPVTVQPYFYNKKKKIRNPAEKSIPSSPKLEGVKPTSPPMEHLRREELINCTCGFTEEDGLMIQCDLCLCWQHGLCNQIENIEDVPQKYVCQICQNPLRERKSRHYIHDQDWLKEGTLPSLSFSVKDPEKIHQREDILKRSHDLCSLLLLTQKVIHSLRVKVHIAEQKDHPKLYLWANSWQTESMGCPTPPSSPTLENDQKPENLDAPRIPQPEAPIDPSECRLKLLDHIEHYQSLIDARLSVLEQMIEELEREDPSLLDTKSSDSAVKTQRSFRDDGDLGEEESLLELLPQTKETVQMILRDLLNLRRISALY